VRLAGGEFFPALPSAKAQPARFPRTSKLLAIAARTREEQRSSSGFNRDVKHHGSRVGARLMTAECGRGIARRPFHAGFHASPSRGGAVI